MPNPRWNHDAEDGWNTNRWLSQNKNRRRRSSAALAARRASSRAFKEMRIAEESAIKAAHITATYYNDVVNKLQPQLREAEGRAAEATNNAHQARSVLAEVKEQMSQQLVEAATAASKLREQLHAREQQATQELHAARALMDRVVAHFNEVQQAAQSEALVIIADIRDRAIAEVAQATEQLSAAQQQAIVLQTELQEMSEQLGASHANWQELQQEQAALMVLYQHTLYFFNACTVINQM